jgi:hypothetical protein
MENGKKALFVSSDVRCFGILCRKEAEGGLVAWMP